MKKFIAILLTAAITFTGCSGKTDTKQNAASEAPKTSSGAPATSSDDRELVVGVATGTSNFDPFNSYGDDSLVHMQVNDNLVVRDKDGNMIPWVAESYDISDDDLTYTFKIRKGIKMSDGNEFTAKDVKFTVDLGIKSTVSNWITNDIASCETPDDYTVVIKINKPDVSFLEKVGWLYLVSEEAYTKHGENYGKTIDAIVGTGPYTVKEWKPGEYVLLEANEDYFMGAPSIKKVRYKAISDANAAVIALQTGEIGLYIKDIPSIAVDSLAKSGKVNIGTFSSYVFMDILLNCESGIFSDPNMRKAVAYAVDREKMLLVGTEGQGTIVDYPGGPDYLANPNIKVFNEYDLEKAKQLVKDAGMEGKTVTIKTMDTDPWPKLATSLQDDLSKIGLVANVEQLEISAYSQDIWVNQDYDIAISRYWSATKDINELMALLLSGHSMNFSKYSNPEVDKYLIAGSSTRNVEVRKENYAKALQIAMPEIPLIPLYYTQGTRAYSKDLTIEEGNVQYNRLFYYSWK